MKTKTIYSRRPLRLATLLVVCGMTVSATVRYVDVNSASPTPPFTNWATAATIIQDAVDAAQAGDEIVVTSGLYQTGGRAVDGMVTNRVAVDKPVTLRSVNGPEVTVIRGDRVPGGFQGLGDGAVRCVYLTNGAALVGFTLTKGATRSSGDYARERSGGGVWCESTNASMTNCILIGNHAVSGGGAYRGTFDNCTLTGNSATFSGGGALDGTLNNCALNGNLAIDVDNQQGGRGGGASGCTLNNCILRDNSAYTGSGGGSYYCTLNNCVLISNFVYRLSIRGGDGGGASFSALNNCVLTGNSAFDGGGAYRGTLKNCILFTNDCYGFDCDDGCDSGSGSLREGNNWCGDPLFVDWAGGNFRLQSNSPCINSGLNTYAPAGLDLESNPRIARGTVDIGAYEFQSPQSAISYAWLQEYGLPTDGSADFTDGDGDGLNNWQEWLCLTDPTNALSALRLLAPARGAPGVTVRWESVTGRNYFLERGTNLETQPPFLPLATDIVGQPGTTTYLDTNAVGTGPLFYRVGVRP